MTIALTRPTIDLFDSWAAAVAEFDGGHIDGAGLEQGVVPDRAACEAFIAMAELYATPGAALPDDRVPCDHFWITEGDQVVGFIAFRRELNDYLRRFGGHIGYSVIPTRRREGIVREALRLLLRARQGRRLRPGDAHLRRRQLRLDPHDRRRRGRARRRDRPLAGRGSPRAAVLDRDPAGLTRSAPQVTPAC
ncbi:GNAT family N-acetyltransferase [Microbacterium sp. Se63.02b]|uniref:GNAT family N-acetyltransferase n=1 Tax=Microbacterium sp. Se63.02b TaxID=2709304 RepID=UPI001FCE4882|nr:GNAT family N-acetyltransferase [Microbacterium sp. Se63.02b]